MIEQKHKLTDTGDIKIHDDAIKSITALTVKKIDGVIGISKNPLRKILDNIGIGKTLNILDGIKIESTTSNLKITLDIIAAYGADISELALKVQEEVKQVVETMTSISSVEVDVNVTGVAAGPDKNNGGVK
jgi:uncharacterized alkaline shock family protein YloU